jgi:hypothetical protein
MLVIVEDPLVPQFLSWLQQVRGPLTTTSTTLLTTLIRGVLHSSHSAHSVKRGALNFLTQLAAKGQIDPQLLPILAKHKGTPTIPETTVRYVTDKVALARVVGTAAATKYL